MRRTKSQRSRAAKRSRTSQLPILEESATRRDTYDGIETARVRTCLKNEKEEGKSARESGDAPTMRDAHIGSIPTTGARVSFLRKT